MHAAVVTGILPLATAAVAALVLRQRPSRGFWACARAGLRAGAGLRGTAGRGAVGASRRLAAAGGAVRRRERLRGRRQAATMRGPRAGDLLGAGDQPAASRCRWHCGRSRRHRCGPRAHRPPVGGFRLCFGVLDVAGLLRLVPRSGAGRYSAGQPGAVAAALPGAAVWPCRCWASACAPRRWCSRWPWWPWCCVGRRMPVARLTPKETLAMYPAPADWLSRLPGLLGRALHDLARCASGGMELEL